MTDRPAEATGRPYRDWTTEELLDRRAGLDYGVMGCAIIGIEVPDEVVKELWAIQEEPTRREGLRWFPPTERTGHGPLRL
jgi:hypothetical protein